MKRWRTVGLIGHPTADGRVLVGTVTVREPVVLTEARTVKNSHQAPRVVGTVPVRVVGDRIEARLARRHRTATPATWPRRTEYPTVGPAPDYELQGLVKLVDPEVIGLCVAGPSAWAELR